MSIKYLNHIDLNKNELQNSVIQNLATAPSSPKKGQIYFDTASNKAMVYNGSAWIPWEADTSVSPATTAPKMDGTAAVGTATKYAREDHVHPTDTSRVPTTRTVNGHALSANVTVTASDVGLGNVTDGAEVNQNAFSNVKVGSTTIAADSKTDTLELTAGSNITLTPDATNDKVTIAATNTTYGAGTQAQLEAGTDTSNRVWQAKILHDYMASVAGSVDAMRFKGTLGTGGDITALPTSGVKVGDTYRVITAGTYASQTCEVGDLIIATATTPTWTVAQTNIDGAITSISGTAPITVSGTGASRTIAISAASQSAAGSMSKDDKTKLDGIAAGAQVNPTYTSFTGKPTANQTPAFGGTFTISQIKQATGGQVSGTDRTVKIPDTEASTSQKGLMTAAHATLLQSLDTAMGSIAIDGFSFAANEHEMSDYDQFQMISHFSYCETAAATAAKVAPSDTATMNDGCLVAVKFRYTNTAAVANLTLKVGDSVAKPIKYRGGNLPSAGTLAAGRVYWFVYDGTNYELIGDLDTTYSSLAAASGGTAVSLVTTGEKYTWNNKASSDTKNTAGSTDSSSKLFLIGATTQGANPQTYSQDTAYVGTDGHLYSDSKQVVNLSGSQALTNKTYNGYTLGAACAKSVDSNITSLTSANLPTSAAVAALFEGNNVIAKNPDLTPSGGICTWTITGAVAKYATNVALYEASSHQQVMADIKFSGLSENPTITIKIISSVDIAAQTYEAYITGSPVVGAFL